MLVTFAKTDIITQSAFSIEIKILDTVNKRLLFGVLIFNKVLFFEEKYENGLRTI